MKKIGIIICNRYHRCGGGKCLRALRERAGAFSVYPKDEQVELVGYSTCGGCPGGNIEYVPAEMIKNGAEVIHLATGLVVGYPPCPSIGKFKEYIESRYKIPVVVGTHPIPMNYWTEHKNLPFWGNTAMRSIAPKLFEDDEETMRRYD